MELALSSTQALPTTHKELSPTCPVVRIALGAGGDLQQERGGQQLGTYSSGSEGQGWPGLASTHQGERGSAELVQLSQLARATTEQHVASASCTKTERCGV
jgi:hypothetical protein